MIFDLGKLRLSNARSWRFSFWILLIKGHDVSNIIHGNTLSEDGLIDKKFDYMLSNPPFGVEWKRWP
jgi:type I restriction enzyme M protein